MSSSRILKGKMKLRPLTKAGAFLQGLHSRRKRNETTNLVLVVPNFAPKNEISANPDSGGVKLQDLNEERNLGLPGTYKNSEKFAAAGNAASVLGLILYGGSLAAQARNNFYLTSSRTNIGQQIESSCLDPGIVDPAQEIAESAMASSLTVGLLRHGRRSPVVGRREALEISTSRARDPARAILLVDGSIAMRAPMAELACSHTAQLSAQYAERSAGTALHT